MSNIDAKIDELFKVVHRQKQDVELAEKESKASWKTNCSINLGATTPHNIQTANETTIRTIVMELLRHQDYAKRADEVLGNPYLYSRKYDNFTYEDWIADCKKRLSVLGLRTKKDNLSQLEKRLDAIVSPEQRRQMELDAITESLGL